jgi:hypothetical protein
MMEALNSSATSVLTRVARHNIPEDAILHNEHSFPFQEKVTFRFLARAAFV